MFGLAGGYLLLAKIGVALALVAALFGFGYRMGSVATGNAKDKIITQQATDYAATVRDATAERDAANERADRTEAQSTASMAANDKANVARIQATTAKTDALVAAYAAGDKRMRVSLATATRAAASSGTLPGPAAAAGGSDDSAVGELSAAAAAGVARVAGRADAIVDQLSAAQDTLEAYYAACGPQRP